MRVLVTGARGQVGWEVVRAFQPLAEVVALDRATLDLADAESVRRTVRAVRPDVVINAAAYTAVDRAEDEPEAAMRINGLAPGWIAEECRALGALLVHYSTDYVWDGSGEAPRAESDPTAPLTSTAAPSSPASARSLPRAGAG